MQQEEYPFGALPYSPDMPFEALIDFIEERSSDLIQMRSLFLERAHHLRINGYAETPKLLERNIADALRLMKDAQQRRIRQTESSQTFEGIRFSAVPFRNNNRCLSSNHDDTFAPLLALESMGYGWKVDSTKSMHHDARYEPSKGETIGAWLVPPEPGVALLHFVPLHQADCPPDMASTASI